MLWKGGQGDKNKAREGEQGKNTARIEGNYFSYWFKWLVYNKDCEYNLFLWPSGDLQKSKRLMREAGEWLEEAENELKQEVGRTSLLSTSFFQALAEKGRVEERVRGDWWSTEVRWSHLCIREVYRLELGTCVWSLLFSGSGCEGEQGERSNETEIDNAREGEHKSRGSVLVEGNC